MALFGFWASKIAAARQGQHSAALIIGTSTIIIIATIIIAIITITITTIPIITINGYGLHGCLHYWRYRPGFKLPGLQSVEVLLYLCNH